MVSATPSFIKHDWLVSGHVGLLNAHIRYLGRSHSVRVSPELREQRRAHSAGDCGAEKRRESTLMKMSGSMDDLIISFTFSTLCPDCCVIMEVFLRGDSSY